MRRRTAIRMAVVVGIIGLIVYCVAVTQRGGGDSIIGAREKALKQNLYTMRNAIDQYTIDQKKRPQSLEQLVSAGYLKTIPKDPITNSTDTWKVAMEDSLMPVDKVLPGISDVHSGSDKKSTDGTEYSTW